jgi:superfamily II DNA/RNA helicase
VFVLYKKEAPRVESTLRRAGYAVGALHGDMSQPARLGALQQFRDGTMRVLVATDVAARGLDIPDVACVFNYSFPLTIEDYVHRIGRTGECGSHFRTRTDTDSNMNQGVGVRMDEASRSSRGTIMNEGSRVSWRGFFERAGWISHLYRTNFRWRSRRRRTGCTVPSSARMLT